MRQWVSRCRPGMQIHKPESSRWCDEDPRCKWQSHLLRSRHETSDESLASCCFTAAVCNHSSDDHLSLSKLLEMALQICVVECTVGVLWPNKLITPHCRKNKATCQKNWDIICEYICTWFVKACGTWIPNLCNSSLKIVEKCVKGW